MTSSNSMAHNWQSIREWDGSQHRAFEELCFQLRTSAPPGWETIKTAAPDGGVEWYDQAPNGISAYGYQVKFVHNIDDLIPQAKKSAKTVGENIANRKIVRLEFLTPFDLSDPTPVTPGGKARTGARERWNNNVALWKRELPGLADVDIRYVGGGELLERLTRPGNEGRQWFFFERRALGSEWLQEQVTLAERLAEARYTPEHHVTLPLAHVADASALPQEFLRQGAQRSRDLQATVVTLLGEMTRWHDRYPQSDSSPAHQALSQWVHAWTPALREGAEALVRALSSASATSGFPAEQAAAVAEDMLERLGEFRDLSDRFTEEGSGSDDAVAPTPAADRGGSGPVSASQSMQGLCDSALARALNACERMDGLMRSAAAQAAEKKTWLLLGEAGQGKTHLLVDAVRRAVDDGRPALVVFGQELTGHNALSEIAQKRGLGLLPERDFLQAMDSAGAASGCRFLLIIDALNDSDDAGNWKSELLALQVRLAGYRHIALLVSCRSTFRSVVVPDRFDGPVSVHSGFAGREMEGLESYLRGSAAVLPNTPLLASVFTNPLFVKLYADSLSKSQERGGSDGHPRDRSAVFDAYVDHRAETICTRLGLDPLERPVHRAVDALASRMAAARLSVLPREEARALADAYAPAATAWPDTMLGQLLAQGIVSNERTFKAEQGTGIGFPYQALGDDRVVRSVFAAHRDEVDSLRGGRSLAVDSSLRSWLHQAAPNYQEAASILLPEQTGTELIDLLADSPPSATDAAGPGRREAGRGFLLARSFLETLPLRSTPSVNERTIELLNETAARHGRNSDVLEAVLAVTAEPGHLLNADRLHRVLLRKPRPERDAWWGVETYSLLRDVTALHRLLRWAEQYPTPHDLHPAIFTARPRLGDRTRPVMASGASAEEAIRLSATTLVWTLTSSNRFLRDRATKALVQLLLGYGDVLVSLLDRFLHKDAEKVDDPYLFERLVWVAYGVLARRGESDSQHRLLSTVARRLLTYCYGDVGSPAHASRNALLCEAATRVVTMAHHAGAITGEEADAVRHPHACAEVGQAPAEEDLDVLFPWREQKESLWGSIRSSLSSLGDFADYQVRPAVGHFSLLPLSSGYPRRPAWQRRDDRVVVDPARIPAFAQSLPEPVRPALSTQAAVEQLLTGHKARQVLDKDQYALLRDCRVPPADDERLAAAQVDAQWAARWVLARVADLGWTPELFAEFDNMRGRHSGSRQSHKGERIGKKYQWMALHELVERLANHRHPHRWAEHDAAEYPGAAQLSLLDIDPSLPPARHPFSDDDDSRPDEADHATFAAADPAHPLTPPIPVLPDAEGVDEWINRPDNLPNLIDLGIRTDSQSRQWVVLHELATDDHDGRGWSVTRGQAEQWHRVNSWLVPDRQLTSLLTWLEGRSLMNRLMPEGADRHSLFLADFPTVPGPWTDPEPESWHVSTFQFDEPESGQDDSPAPDDEGLASLETRHGPTAPARADGLFALWREKRERRQDELLLELAKQWADGPVEDTDDEDDWLDRILTTQPQGRMHYATDPTGQPVTAIPTDQTYNWSGQDLDCSLDASVSVTLPSDPLLRGGGLRRDPDQPCWYDADGQLQVQYLTWDRPSGKGYALLASREWLEQRLQRSGHCLVQGMLGERQTVTAEHPRAWREFSQSAGHTAQGRRDQGTIVTAVKRSFG
ncbi:hypothetical protein ABTY00_36810 [Streptomyces microflavus]|uniref:hypothetical protein n=1 Tax=Streptomyces microflavus TaxID=1919 RepID=UPI00331F2FE3